MLRFLDVCSTTRELTRTNDESKKDLSIVDSQVSSSISTQLLLMLTHALRHSLCVAEGEEDEDEQREEGRLDEVGAAQATAEKVLAKGRPTAVGFTQLQHTF